MILKQIRAFLIAEVTIELRNRFLAGSVLLYVFACIGIIYYSLQFNSGAKQTGAAVWGILYWLIMLFTSAGAMSNLFLRENNGRHHYWYWSVSPLVFLLGKMIYNLVFTLLLAILAWIALSVVTGQSSPLNVSFFLVLILGTTGFSLLFTLMSALASRSGQNSLLVAVLGFPLSIPLMIFITRLTAAGISGNASGEEWTKNLMLVGAYDLIELALGVVLFPYIWRD